jgi:hypothetical protein
MIKVQHLQTKKDFFGLHDVTVVVNGSGEYTYTLGSEHEVDVFVAKMRFHPGRALNYLKKIKIGEVIKK